MLTVCYRLNKKTNYFIPQTKGGKRKFLLLNDSVYPARNLPEGFKIGLSEIMVELSFLCNITFIIY
jgi:hypothetical protein